ncbi:MAG TPA: PorP/SprF family type IX secretion system membrane protein [Flavobacterium sp.]|nr:PorP/SprF family type IX secretion system membrane protein [Flavobacterium sp.]
MKLKLLLLSLLVALSLEVKAQDAIFTQYFLVPETLNPAFTGTLGAWYTGIIHRTQWPDGTKKLSTNFGFVNGPIDGDGKMSAGITLLNNREVFTDLNFFQANGVFAYNIELDGETKLRLGLEAGYGMKNYDFSGLVLEDQIDINNGSISNGSVDSSLYNYGENISFFDLSTGILLYNDNAWFGASLKHLNQPEIAFTPEGNVPLSMFFSAQAGYSFELNSFEFIFNDEANLLLTANYMRQSEYNRLDIGGAFEVNKFTIGALAAMNIEGKSEESHLLTSINLFVSMQLDRFVLGYSYDINTSNFGNSQGIHELSLTFQIGRDCPTCNNYLVKRPWGRNY